MSTPSTEGKAVASDDRETREVATPAQMLANPDYPSEYGWGVLIHKQQDDYDRKMIENLKAILSEVRATPTPPPPEPPAENEELVAVLESAIHEADFARGQYDGGFASDHDPVTLTVKDAEDILQVLRAPQPTPELPVTEELLQLERLNEEAWSVHAEQLRTMAMAPGLNRIQETGLLMAAGACERAAQGLALIFDRPHTENPSPVATDGRDLVTRLREAWLPFKSGDGHSAYINALLNEAANFIATLQPPDPTEGSSE